MRHTIECKIALGNLGCYEGPPIRQCPIGEKLASNARIGSQKLLNAIRKAGVRP